MLDHKIYDAGLEVDRAKISIIERLPPPTNVKGVQSFLGYVGFYRSFIKNFSQIAKPLSTLLEKNTTFQFTGDCMIAFKILKERLTSTPMII